MKDLKEILEQGEGYKIFSGFVPATIITDYKKILKDLYPVRASSSKKVYAERNYIKDLTDISVWWSQTVHEFESFVRIKKLVDNIVESNFSNLTFYAADTVTINPLSQWFNPHVDTPHRFEKYNFDKNLLGIQSIITLEDVTKENASTGLVPYSQKRDFDINECYRGKYDRWFLDNCKQFDLPKGSLLIYNSRILHSSMPNHTYKARPALLINYLDKNIVDEVIKIDNIWKSNDKNS